MYVAHVGLTGLERDCHSLGGPRTPPVCFAVNNRLHMDRTTSWVLCSGLAACNLQLERIRDIGTRFDLAQTVVNRLQWRTDRL